MISIARHIEILLLDHDCVIVPGLGAFIANHASAKYNEDGDSMFLPPYRSICYNQNLATNDGLMVQAYMSAYDAAYPEALKQMNMDVADMLDELDIKGEYNLKGIGTLYKDVNGNITFTQQNVGILTPPLYGLYSFSAKSWEEVLKEKQLKETLEQALVIPINTKGISEDNNKDTATAKEDNKRVGKNKTKFIDIAVAAAAAVLLFFLFSYPAFKSTTTANETFIASSISISKPTEKSSKKEITVETIAEPSAQTSKTALRPDELIVEPAIPVVEETEKKFVIVLATCVTERNANVLIEKLKRDGYSDVIFDDSGKMNRITYSSFATFKEANEELSTLRHLSPFFKEAWVYNTNK